MGTTRRVVVVGGSGFLGSRAVAALERTPGITVATASRSSATRVDLSDPSTFEALQGADVVVDLADATTTPPDALARWCLERGVVFVETTSDMVAVDRLAKIASAEPKGAIVLGAGIFTGVSNLLAHAAAKRAGPGARLELGVRTTPFSGAGKGTVALMAGMLSVPAVSYRGGERQEHAPMGRGPRLDFPCGPAPSLRVPFAEEVMLHASTGARDVDVYFAPKPALLVWAFTMIPLFVARSAFFAAFMRVYFNFLRRVLLANRVSSTEIVATAEGPSGRVTLGVTAPDGMGAGGLAIAAIVAEILERAAPPRGTLMVDEVVALEPILSRMRALGGDDAIVFHDGPAPG
jgi:short subunit dehydrogenase-like uncharacterized protein